MSRISRRWAGDNGSDRATDTLLTGLLTGLDRFASAPIRPAALNVARDPWRGVGGSLASSRSSPGGRVEQPSDEISSG
jgi:hypothetical protein